MLCQEQRRVEDSSYLKANQLASHNHMEAGKRQETPGSEARTLLHKAQQVAWASYLHSSPYTQLMGDKGRWAQIDVAQSGFTWALSNPEFKKS